MIAFSSIWSPNIQMIICVLAFRLSCAVLSTRDGWALEKLPLVKRYDINKILPNEMFIFRLTCINYQLLLHYKLLMNVDPRESSHERK